MFKFNLGKKIKLAFLATIITGIIAVGIAAVSYYPLQEFIARSTQEVQAALNPAEAKKQNLTKLIYQVVVAQNNQDWAIVYNLSASKYFKSLVTEKQFIHGSSIYAKASLLTKTNISSELWTVNNIQIQDNNAVVNETMIACLISTCSRSNNNVFSVQTTWEYVNGQWTPADQKPSERALKDASEVYSMNPKYYQENFAK